MSFTRQQLHDQIEADPEGLGYKEAGGEWKDDQVVADLINAKNYIIDRDNTPMEDTRATVTYDAYNNLSIDEQEWITWMTPNSGEFRVNADMKLQLTGRTLTVNGVPGSGADNDSFWAAADDQDMAPVMLALIEVPGSWAEVLWGERSMVSVLDVAYAANL